MKKILQRLALYPNKADISALLVSFFIINFAFLYHSLTFMWGNHDVAFIKDELLLSSGLFEGRFTQFIPYRLLTNGQILPIINNFIGFTLFTIALWILAKYWKLPPLPLSYVLFISFFATQPYTLSWMYFTFITISCLLWTMLAALGLYLSEQAYNNTYKKTLCLCSILCFYLTLGGYPPIINMFAVCLCARIVIAILFENKTISQLIAIYKYTLINIVLAGIFFKLTLLVIMPDNVYNLETSPLTTLPHKFLSTLKISFTQFFIALPFMEKGYKLVLAAMSFCAIIGAILKSTPPRQTLILLAFLIATIWATSLTTFLVVPHTEYVSRIDFYGYAFLYAFFLALLLKYRTPFSQTLALIFMLILIPFNIINDYRAQKVWKLGFDAEMQILNRITERIEQHPNFNPNRQYHFHQIGDITLRPQYYHGIYDKNDVFLLTIPYLAIWQSGNLAEFYSPYNYVRHDSQLSLSDITPEVYDFFMSKAKTWPHENSIYVINNTIFVILNTKDLDEFKNKLLAISPQNKTR